MVGSGGLGRCVSQEGVGIESTRYEIRNRNQCRTLNAKCRRRYNVPRTKYKVGIRIGIGVLVFKDLGTWYVILRTTFSVLILDTTYLILFLMSNAERRLKYEEGGTMYQEPSTK